MKLNPNKKWKWATRTGHSQSIELWTHKPTKNWLDFFVYEGVSCRCMTVELHHFKHNLKPNECRMIHK